MVQDLKQSTLWWNGPCILISPDRPESTKEDVLEDEVKSEFRSRYQIVAQFVNQDIDFLKPVLCLEKCSKLKTVLRVTAWMKRFITNTCSCIKMTGELTAEELNEARKYWIKGIQNQSFNSEIELLKAGKYPNTDSSVHFWMKMSCSVWEEGSSILISLTEKSTHGFCPAITDIQKCWCSISMRR